MSKIEYLNPLSFRKDTDIISMGDIIELSGSINGFYIMALISVGQVNCYSYINLECGSHLTTQHDTYETINQLAERIRSYGFKATVRKVKEPIVITPDMKE